MLKKVMKELLQQVDTTNILTLQKAVTNAVHTVLFLRLEAHTEVYLWKSL